MSDDRKVCTPENPMPKDAPGRWAHTNAVDNGECSQGCCDYYRCTDCGATWRGTICAALVRTESSTR